MNLIELTCSSLDFEIFSDVIAPDYVSFLDAREAMLLFLLRSVSASGPVLTFPPTLLQVASDVSAGKQGLTSAAMP